MSRIQADQFAHAVIRGHRDVVPGMGARPEFAAFPLARLALELAAAWAFEIARREGIRSPAAFENLAVDIADNRTMPPISELQRALPWPQARHLRSLFREQCGAAFAAYVVGGAKPPRVRKRA